MPGIGDKGTGKRGQAAGQLANKAGTMPPTAPAPASLPSSVLALEVQGADSTGK